MDSSHGPHSPHCTTLQTDEGKRCAPISDRGKNSSIPYFSTYNFLFVALARLAMPSVLWASIHQMVFLSFGFVCGGCAFLVCFSCNGGKRCAFWFRVKIADNFLRAFSKKNSEEPRCFEIASFTELPWVSSRGIKELSERNAYKKLNWEDLT